MWNRSGCSGELTTQPICAQALHASGVVRIDGAMAPCSKFPPPDAWWSVSTTAANSAASESLTVAMSNNHSLEQTMARKNEFDYQDACAAVASDPEKVNDNASLIAIDAVVQVAKNQPHKFQFGPNFAMDANTEFWLGVDLARRLGMPAEHGHICVYNAVGALQCDWESIPQAIADAPARKRLAPAMNFVPQFRGKTACNWNLDGRRS